MNTKSTMHEQISAFADGEADESQIDAALAALRTPEGRAAWEDYHRIGDAVRSDDMAFAMSDDFAAKLMKRLDDEPAIVAAPRRQAAEISTVAPEMRNTARTRRFMVPGMAAAAMAVVTVIVAQQWIGSEHPAAEANVASVAVPASARASMVAATGGARASTPNDADLKRDPGIDEYLMAHQRFSPSLYSTAQYARTATFAADADK